jgi:hypothetical protein
METFSNKKEMLKRACSMAGLEVYEKKKITEQAHSICKCRHTQRSIQVDRGPLLTANNC